MGRKITISAGERTKVFRLFSSSIPSTICFTATPTNGDVMGGTIEVKRWHWFTWKSETYPLAAENQIEKGFGDADFIIHVTPEQECEIVFGARKFGGSGFLIIAAGLVIGIIAAAALVFALSPPPGP